MGLAPTGIVGLDELLGGGIPEGSWTLVSGPSGSGKTVLGMQFIWEGLQRKEKVAYDCVDRPYSWLSGYFFSFGRDISPAVELRDFLPVQSFPTYANYRKLGSVLYYDPRSFEELRGVWQELARQEIKRFVSGDYTLNFWASLPVEQMIATKRWNLEWAFQESITAIELLTTGPGDEEYQDVLGLIQKDMTNIIELRLNEGRREMRIVKMEGVAHPLDWLPFRITPKGIVLEER
ncbi:MAG: hypothetical protein HYX89_06210 [Chloroflexi bacterium]|nr:hypothetical protein [Chloroflexota bacterium]